MWADGVYLLSFHGNVTLQHQFVQFSIYASQQIHKHLQDYYTGVHRWLVTFSRFVFNERTLRYVQIWLAILGHWQHLNGFLHNKRLNWSNEKSIPDKSQSNRFLCTLTAVIEVSFWSFFLGHIVAICVPKCSNNRC